MGLEEEARRAAEDADVRAKAAKAEAHASLVRDGESRMRSAVVDWAAGMPVTKYELGEIWYEAAHDSDYGSGPKHPARLVARLICGDARLRAYFNLEEASFRWAGSTDTTQGLHVYLDRYHGGMPIDVWKITDLGRAYQASDAAKLSTEPSSEYFGISISRKLEKIILGAIGIAIVVLIILAVSSK